MKGGQLPPSEAGPRLADLSHAQLLEAVPTPNRAVRCETRGDSVLLWVPLRQRWWLQRTFGWLLPVRREKGISLDRIGSEVWRACDGEQTVEQIVAAFAGRHQLRFHEARAAVSEFLGSLVTRNLLVLVVPAPGAALPDAGAQGAVMQEGA
jgi:hypothetical protein